MKKLIAEIIAELELRGVDCSSIGGISVDEIAAKLESQKPLSVGDRVNVLCPPMGTGKIVNELESSDEPYFKIELDVEKDGLRFVKRCASELEKIA